MRIVFMGTPDFAVPSLRALHEAGHDICGVFTQPDKPRNRGMKLQASPVKGYALSQNLPVFQPSKMRDGEALAVLKELAPERKAARAAIERLAAAPVMFELGARPHPPRDLYRAYLEQSDIFVGLYWEKYGWVAPEESVSGLEDEYNLAPPTMPRLMYIKETTGTREPSSTTTTWSGRIVCRSRAATVARTRCSSSV